jgi:hypothetical protein
MKLQATVWLTIKAPNLQEAGALLDDLLTAATRDGVSVDRVELSSPPAPAQPVVLPVPERSEPPAPPSPRMERA